MLLGAASGPGRGTMDIASCVLGSNVSPSASGMRCTPLVAMVCAGSGTNEDAIKAAGWCRRLTGRTGCTAFA
jgi:hypothetical protein